MPVVYTRLAMARSSDEHGSKLRASGCDCDCQACQTARVRRMREDQRAMGPSAHLSGMRDDTLLRQFAEPPRDQTSTFHWTPCGGIGRTRRALAVLLSGRRVSCVLEGQARGLQG